MAVIGIDYDGGNFYDDEGNLVKNPVQYECVTLNTRSGNFKFDSGDFIKDWFSAYKKYTEISEKDPFFSHSSSVNHFIMDGAKYKSAYLHQENENFVLKYLDRSDKNWIDTQREIYENGLEFFVEPGSQPTWEELREYCNSL